MNVKRIEYVVAQFCVEIIITKEAFPNEALLCFIIYTCVRKFKFCSVVLEC